MGDGPSRRHHRVEAPPRLLPVAEPDVRSVCDLLARRSAEQGDHRAYTFLERGEVDAGHLTWRALERQSHAIACGIRTRVEPRARVLLLCPPGLDFVAALFAVFGARTIAVPAHPPGAGRSRKSALRLQNVIVSAGVELVLADPTVTARADALCTLVPQLRCLPWATIAGDPGGHPRIPWERGPGTDEIALLEYPPGTRCVTHGVMTSHGGLLSDLADHARLGLHDASAIAVSWLPMSERTGLVEGILQPAFSGYPAWLMSPSAFVERPRRWLHAISTLRATHSGAPGFAFDLCVDRVPGPDRAGLDLSSWRVASSGGQPPPRATIDAFARAFRPAGFRRSAFRPFLQRPAPPRAIIPERRKVNA